MHILGKVLLWFSLPLIITAVVFTTMLLDIRQNWKSQFKTAQEAVHTSTDALRVEDTKTRALVEQNSQLQHSWGNAWVAPNGNGPQGRNGILEIGVGSGKGLGQKAQLQNKQPANIFVFANTGAQESQFLGEFKVIQLRIDNTTGELARIPYPGEEATWPSGAYRVRDTLPAGWLATLDELNSQVLISTRHLAVQREQLVILTKQIEESQKSLDQRLAELNGDAEAPEGAEQEVVDGLVATVRRLELERNEVLAQVDSLRHELNDSYVLLRETLDENTKMSERIAAAADGSAAPQVELEAKRPVLTVRPTISK